MCHFKEIKKSHTFLLCKKINKISYDILKNPLSYSSYFLSIFKVIYFYSKSREIFPDININFYIYFECMIVVREFS